MAPPTKLTPLKRILFLVTVATAFILPARAQLPDTGKIVSQIVDQIKQQAQKQSSAPLTTSDNSQVAQSVQESIPRNENTGGTGGTLRIISGDGAFSSASASNKVLHVTPGATLSGAVNLHCISIGCAVPCVTPLIYTPSWGEHSNSWRLINAWIPAAIGDDLASGTSEQRAQVSLVAPTMPGVYHIIFAFEWQIGGDHVASASNWGLHIDRWNDGNDIAELSETQLAEAQAKGYTSINWLCEDGYKHQYVPADALTVVVSATQDGDSWGTLGPPNPQPVPMALPSNVGVGTRVETTSDGLNCIVAFTLTTDSKTWLLFSENSLQQAEKTLVPIVTRIVGGQAGQPCTVSITVKDVTAQAWQNLKTFAQLLEAATDIIGAIPDDISKSDLAGFLVEVGVDQVTSAGTLGLSDIVITPKNVIDTVQNSDSQFIETTALIDCRDNVEFVIGPRHSISFVFITARGSKYPVLGGTTTLNFPLTLGYLTGDPGYGVKNALLTLPTCGAGPSKNPTMTFAVSAQTKLPPNPAPPQITSVNSISAKQTQTIAITGHGFGTQSSFDGTSKFLRIHDDTAEWDAGWSGGTLPDWITVDVSQWTDTQIVINGFTGAYALGEWKLNSGDKLTVSVWNAQTGSGPATMNVTVGSGNSGGP